ncbi:N/A [soil metagenome]
MTAPVKPRSSLLRGVYLVLGLICVGFAYVSWLPGIPTFDFVILAAFFFARSSDRFHNWLIGHPFFGKIIAGYREGGFTVKAKAWISAAVVLSLGFSIVVLSDRTAFRVVLAAVGFIALWFIWSRPTRENSEPWVGTGVQQRYQPRVRD